jgi:hypothetical protein
MAQDQRLIILTAWAEMKLCFYIGSCAIIVAAEYTGISKLIAGVLT